MLTPIIALVACGGTPASAPPAVGEVPPSQSGRASWYGRRFAGRPTASGEPFDPSRLTAAHRTLPMGTRLEVTHLENGRSVEVVVNDRGPFARNRVLDLSRAAAERLDIVDEGHAPVELTVVSCPDGATCTLGAKPDPLR